MSVSINATNLVSNSLKLIGVLSDGENADASMLADGFNRLNELIDGLGVQRQSMLARVRTVYSLVANQATYTFGPSGDFNNPRPITVEGCGLILNSSSPALEIGLTPLTDDQFQAIGIKALTSTLPEESGVSPRAAGFKLSHQTDGGGWGRPSRARGAPVRGESKLVWEKSL